MVTAADGKISQWKKRKRE